MLQAKERAQLLLLSLFTFGLVVESIKELGGALDFLRLIMYYKSSCSILIFATLNRKLQL
jgi:hypothetical protein